MATPILTPILNNDFQVNEYDYFGAFNLEIKITRESYMREDGWQEFTASLSTAINDTFYFYYIGRHPLEEWVILFTARLNRSVRKYYPQIMNLFSDGEEINILDGGEDGHKNKLINSQFPQTIIQESEAYATDGTDDVGRTVKTLGAIEALKAVNDPVNPYENVINYILTDIECCFSQVDF